MPWYRVTDSQSRSWEVDPAGFAYIVRSSIRNRAMLRRSRQVTISGGLLWPTRVNFETDFVGINAEVDQTSERFVTDGWRQASLQGAGLFGSLVGLRSDALNDGDEYRRRSMAASHQSQENLTAAIDRGEMVVRGLQFTRDTSAGILLAGATVVSGGAAAALVAGLGTGLRFAARVEDGGTVGQAAAGAALDLVVFAVTRGAASTLAGPTVSLENFTPTMAQRGTLAFLGVVMNTGADLARTAVNGDAIRNPLAGAGARVGAETVNALLSNIVNVRGLPILATLNRSAPVRDALTGAALGFVGDRVVDAVRAAGAPSAANPLRDVLRTSPALASAEQFVRETAMRPV